MPGVRKAQRSEVITESRTTARVSVVVRGHIDLTIFGSSLSVPFDMKSGPVELCLKCAEALVASPESDMTLALAAEPTTSTCPKRASKRSAVKSGRARSGSG